MRTIGPDHLARGVYRLPYLSEDGRPLLVAVTGRGRRFVERAVASGQDERAVAAVLARMLDTSDPPHAS